MTRTSFKALTVLVIFAALALQGCRGGYRYGGGHRHGPGWGHGPGRGHGGGWGRGGGHRGGHRLMAETEMKALDMRVAAEEAEDSVALLANDYGIKYESAQQFILLADDKDTSAVAEKMGIGLLELAPLAKLEMPSAETLDKISKNLGEDRATIENLVVDFIADIQAEDAETK